LASIDESMPCSSGADVNHSLVGQTASAPAQTFVAAQQIEAPKTKGTIADMINRRFCIFRTASTGIGV
jgi:hypothetical protein